jgi:hypothetical protein
MKATIHSQPEHCRVQVLVPRAIRTIRRPESNLRRFEDQISSSLVLSVDRVVQRALQFLRVSVKIPTIPVANRGIIFDEMSTDVLHPSAKKVS